MTTDGYHFNIISIICFTSKEESFRKNKNFVLTFLMGKKIKNIQIISLLVHEVTFK